MGYALLWLGSLAAALCLVAAGLAGSTRRPTRRGRVLFTLIGLAFVSLSGLAALGITVVLKFGSHFAQSWFGYSLAWNLCFGVGSGLLVWRAFRSRDGEPAGRTWPIPWLGASTGIFALLTLLTFWSMDSAMLSQMHTLRAEAGAMALAAAAPRVPDHENAAPLYQEAFESLLALSDRPPIPKKRLDKWLGGEVEEADLDGDDLPRLLAAAAGDLALVRRAAALPGCHFEHSTHSLISVQLPELGLFRTAGRWLCLEARFALSRNDTSTAIRNVAAISRMAAHAGETFLISALVGFALEGQASELLDIALSTARPAGADWGPLLALPHRSHRMALQRAMRSEMAAGLEAYAMIAESSLTLDHATMQLFSLHQVKIGLPLWRLFYLPADLAHYRSYLQDYVNRLSMPHSCERPKRGPASDEAPAGPFFGLSSMLRPGLERIGESAARADAHHRLLRVAAAVAAYRDAEGKYPARMDDLRPKYIERIPLDPFDDKPLRLAAKGTGVVVYSVGQNQKDDGGDPSIPDGEGGQPRDLCIRIGTGK